MRPFPAGQNPTGILAFVLSMIAVVSLVLSDFVGLGNSLLLMVACVGATLLGFILGAYAHVERHPRNEAATSALITTTALIVYYAATRFI
jgi:hypothetical protein